MINTKLGCIDYEDIKSVNQRSLNQLKKNWRVHTNISSMAVIWQMTHYVSNQNLSLLVWHKIAWKINKYAQTSEITHWIHVGTYNSKDIEYSMESFRNNIYIKTYI